MIISQKQAFLFVAALCVFCGSFRLLERDESSFQVAPFKKPRSLVTKDKSAFDYQNCLANLNGLEKALIQAAIESRIDPKLLLAVMTVESDCSLDSISARGAVGLMQILPSTASGLGKYNAHYPEDNIRAGAKYLRELKDRFGPDLALTLAAYNAGPATVRRYRGVPPYKETRNYVAKVLKVYSGSKL